MNTYDTLFLMAYAVNPLTCIYAEDFLIFFFCLSLPSRAYVGGTELQCLSVLGKSRKAHLKDFSFFSALVVTSKNERR